MKPSLKTILISGIVAGILDCISAVVFLGKMNFAGVWKYVASGYFGTDAFAGGNEMVVYGLFFHFLIAMFWAVIFYFIFSKINFFNTNPIIGGLLYGIIIWLAMNLIVLPFTHIPKSNFTTISVAKNIVILMLCVGLPISLIANRKNTQ
jgi:hypothetical protein